MGSLVLTLALLAAAGALWASLCFVWPAVARARFVENASAIRDDVDDCTLYGDLPQDSEAVARFLHKVDLFLDEPGEISLSLMLAIHFTYASYDGVVLEEADVVTYAGLSPDQRKLMHDFDQRLGDELAKLVARGSRFYVPVWTVLKLAGGGSKLRQKLRPMVSPPRASELAHEFNRLPDHNRFLQHA
jgi:hypothetical protein